MHTVARRFGLVIGLFVVCVPAVASAHVDLKAASRSSAGAQGDLPSVGREVPALRTRTSETFRGSHGRLVARVFGSPVNFRDDEGDFQPIDNALRGDGNGGFRNGANDFTATFPSKLSDAVRIERGGRSVAFSLRGAAARVSGERAVFGDVLKATDATYETSGDAVKETLTLASSDAPGDFVFDLSLSDGLAPKLNAAGGVDVRDPSGRIVFAMPAPTAADAGGESAPADAVSFVLAPSGGGWALRLHVDAAWLGSSKRAFPVAVDPTTTIGPAATDCMIENDTPDTSICSIGLFNVGRADNGGGFGVHNHTGLLNFNVADALPRGAVVLDAGLWVWVNDRLNANTKQVGVHRVTRSWTNAVTWNTYDGTNAWTAPGGDLDSTVIDTQTIGAVHAWQTWQIGDLVSDWADGGSGPSDVTERLSDLLCVRPWWLGIDV